MSTIKFSDYLTVAQAAKAASVSTRRIVQLIAGGKIRAERMAGIYFIPRDEWQRFSSVDRLPGNPNFRGKKRNSKKS